MDKHKKSGTGGPIHATNKGQAPHGRPPVVAVLGHVDHGKTTLLDTIRKTSVASSEHGGITQHIGAYQIEYTTKSKDVRPITFIDTPGHEAFSKIRSRGATAADVAILVVAANDSVKPQTIESIHQIKAAGIPMIVAINKIDLPGVIVEKVKSDLAKHEVQVEGYGGDVPCVLVSAKSGKGVDELLELIILLADMKGLPLKSDGDVSAVVIEAKIDKFRGMVATLLVKEGTLSVSQPLFEDVTVIGKVRAMFDDAGKGVKTAAPSKPVEVLGFSVLPSVGAVVSTIAHEKVSSQSSAEQKETSAADFLAAMTAAEKKRLKLFIKADTAGSLEAVLEALPKDDVDIVHGSLGDITEADIMEAGAMGAVVVGFNVKAANGVEKLATHEKVIYRIYTIIYELLEEMEDVVTGMEALLIKERELGKGSIIAEFPFEKDRIAGTKVISGRIAKGDIVRIIRGEEEIGRAKVRSIRQGKNEVTKVEVGGECGILFDKKVDFLLQDGIIAFTTG